MRAHHIAVVLALALAPVAGRADVPKPAPTKPAPKPPAAPKPVKSETRAELEAEVEQLRAENVKLRAEVDQLNAKEADRAKRLEKTLGGGPSTQLK